MPDRHDPEFVRADSRGRVTLGLPTGQGYTVTRHADGNLTLEPAMVIRAKVVDHLALMAAPCDRCGCPRADHGGDDNAGSCQGRPSPDDLCQCERFRPRHANGDSTPA